MKEDNNKTRSATSGRINGKARKNTANRANSFGNVANAKTSGLIDNTVKASGSFDNNSNGASNGSANAKPSFDNSANAKHASFSAANANASSGASSKTHSGRGKNGAKATNQGGQVQGNAKRMTGYKAEIKSESSEVGKQNKKSGNIDAKKQDSGAPNKRREERGGEVKSPVKAEMSGAGKAAKSAKHAEKKATKFKVTFLGGVSEIGKNMTAIEYGDDMILVDAGIAFMNAPGIDAVLPDITYVRDNISKLKGIALTHGHEDHIGAVQYYVDDFKSVPIYGTAFTLGLLERKLEKKAKKCRLERVEYGDVVQLGAIRVEFIKVCHSMAGACALAIYMGENTVFVSGDFKIDNTPIDGKKTDLQRISQIGAKGVTLMLGESTNVERKGSSPSEMIVGESLDNIFIANAKKRIVIACFASSNYRVQQVLNLANRYNRKVLLAGKSMKGMIEVASNVGELNVPNGIIVNSVGKLRPEEPLVLATGSQGEPLSALNKMSKGEFNKINIGRDDVVVLSSSPIPGNEKSVYDVINALFQKGAEVIYDSASDIHVSGHAYVEELKLMLTLVRPKYFMPVHGEYRHQVKHAKIATALGVESANVIIPAIGESYFVSQKGIKKQANVPSGNAYVDGVVLDDGETIVNDRLSLAQYGMLVLTVAIRASRGVVTECEVISRGFNLTEERRKNIINAVTDSVNASDFDKEELDEYAKLIKRTVRKLIAKDRQFPIIIPVIFEE